MKLSSKKDKPPVDWKALIIENRQQQQQGLRLDGEKTLAEKLELLWEYAMLFGSDAMRDYYAEQKKQFDIRSQLLKITKVIPADSENAIPNNTNAAATYDRDTFTVPEGANLETLLHQYANSGFDYGIEKLWEASEQKLNLCTVTEDANGFTPLHGAAFHGHVACCKLLLDLGANIEAKSTREFTPLVCAAMANKVEVFDYLLSRGADLHTKPRGGTILHCATYHLSIIRKLVFLGVPVDWVDGSLKTPLFKCAENNNVEGALQLLDFGAKLFRPDVSDPLFQPIYPIVIRTSDIKYKIALLMKHVIIQGWSIAKYMFIPGASFYVLPIELKTFISVILFDYTEIDVELRKRIGYRVDVLK